MRRHLLPLILIPAALMAQQPKPIVLKPANGTLRDPVALGFVRELRDGRILAASPAGVVVADFVAGTAHVVPDVPSRGTFVPLGGDSTLVQVRTNGWYFLDGDKLIGMLPLTNKVVAMMSPGQPMSADARGFVITVTGGQPASDSATVLQIHRTTGEQSLVTRVWQGTPVMGGIPAPVYVVNEEPVLALDGWVAVVRAHPYRVDWRNPAGQWLRGAPLPVPAIALDAREQAAYWQSWGQAGPITDAHIDWPKFVEPFTYPQPIATPDGKLLVKRTATADAPGIRYDVINRRGELEGQFTLAGLHDRIAGFGAHSIYLLTVDAGKSRIGQLERHPWP